MAEPQSILIIDGQEVEQGDFNLLGQTAGLADDRVFAELLRLVPYTAGATKAILPYGHVSASGATVQAPGLANGSVKVFPFRAIVGSRATIAGSSGLVNWRDIRSGIYATSGDATNPGALFGLTANASGNPRWDLVYASLAVDANGPSVTRQVKNPTTSVVAPQSISQYLTQTIAVGVTAGTPGASPAFPAAPVDAAGTYYIPLAYVRVPNGFGAGSTVSALDIYEVAPTVPLARTLGGATLMPANGNNKQTGAVLTSTNFAWTTTVATRPGPYMPPSMMGSESLFFVVDMGSATAANNSHQTGAVIDDSRDWSKRLFRSTIFAGGGGQPFPWDKSSGAAGRSPSTNVTLPGYAPYVTMGQSFTNEANGLTTGSVTNGGAVAAIAPAQLSNMAASSAIVIYVDFNDANKLKLWTATTQAQSKLVFWIDSTAPYANY